MAALRSAYEKLNLAVGLVSGFALLFAGCILFLEVVCRYTGNPTAWVAETSVYLFASAMLLGSAYTLMRGRHVRVELLIERLSPRAQDVCYLVTNLGGMAFCILIACHGWVDLMDVIETGETTATTMRVPLWITEMPLFIGFVLLSAQFFVLACDRIARLRLGSPAGQAKAGGGH